MNHNRNMRKFSRRKEHRMSMLNNLAKSLIKHNRINTTLAKAKDLRRVVEKLITKAKTDSLHTRRLLIKKLKSNKSEGEVNKLLKVISPRYLERNGGYTRIMKDGFRKGDMAPMAIIELV